MLLQKWSFQCTTENARKVPFPYNFKKDAHSNNRREKVSLENLVIGLECGRSDPSSGIIANPIMGLISDKLVNLGGSVILGETIEWLGAEHLLIKRTVSNKIKNKIMNSLNSQINFAKSKNIDLLGNNPGFQNIEAGLSTIEEKSH